MGSLRPTHSELLASCHHSWKQSCRSFPTIPAPLRAPTLNRTQLGQSTSRSFESATLLTWPTSSLLSVRLAQILLNWRIWSMEPAFWLWIHSFIANLRYWVYGFFWYSEVLYSIVYSVQFKLCTLMHGIHNSHCPAYLSDTVQSVATTSKREGLRSAATTNYVTPRLRTKFGERAFSHAGPSAWSRLPEAVCQAQTQLQFKKLLKTFLFNEFLWLRFITDVVMSADLSFVSGH